jgi:hypothetical protein
MSFNTDYNWFQAMDYNKCKCEKKKKNKKCDCKKDDYKKDDHKQKQYYCGCQSNDYASNFYGNQQFASNIYKQNPCISYVCNPCQKKQPQAICCERGPQGPPGPPGKDGKDGKDTHMCCDDFFFPSAVIVGGVLPATAFPFLATFAAITGLTFPLPFTPAPVGVSAANPIGTIVPTAGVFPSQSTTANICCSQDRCVVYDPTLNCFKFLKPGLYKITYYIQGVIQAVLQLLGCNQITFGAFNVGGNNAIPIPQSQASIATPVTNPNAFNLTKEFCVFVPKVAHANDCPIAIPSANSPCLQFGVVNPDADCIGAIFNITTTATAPVTAVPLPGVTVSAPGTLLPTNAFEVTFERISDTCEPKSHDKCEDKHEDKCERRCDRRW